MNKVTESKSMVAWGVRGGREGILKRCVATFEGDMFIIFSVVRVLWVHHMPTVHH